MTWNLRRLGHGEKRLDLVAQLFADQDIVVVQEVMSVAGVDELIEHLPGWKAVVSPRAVGTAGYAEYYAVLYRSAVVSLTRDFLVDDPTDQFAREPYVVCLVSGALDFCVVSIHVVFGKSAGPRNAEVEALGPLLEMLAADSDERDWILVGDFNRPARSACWSPLHQRGFAMTTEDRRVPTSISAGGYRNDYDHILLRPEHTREWQRDADRVDFVARLCGGDFGWCMQHVSDHAPFHATFSTAGPDDD